MAVCRPFESQASRAYQEIRRMIADGDLAPGEKVTLTGLAGRVQMSVIPVRDAVKQLAYDRLLERSGRASFRVLSLSRERLMELSILREAIETQAAREAAQRVTETDIGELRRLAEKLDRTIVAGLVADSIAMEEAFHLKIAEIARCGELVTELERLQLVYATFPVDPSNLIMSHEELADALASRDPDRAEGAMRRHVLARREKILGGIARIVSTRAGGAHSGKSSRKKETPVPQ